MLPPALSSYHQWAKTPGLNSSCFHLLQAPAIEQLRTFLQLLIFLATTSATLNFGSFRLYLTFSSSLRKRKPALFQKDFLVPSECYLLLYLDCTDYKATSYSGQWSANVSSIQQPPTNSYSVRYHQQLQIIAVLSTASSGSPLIQANTSCQYSTSLARPTYFGLYSS